jgi:cytochrome c551/c552
MLVPRRAVNKSKFLRIAIPFFVLFFILAGILYWQQGAGHFNLSIGAAPPASLLEYDAEGKSPREIAKWIYDNHGCVSCHTLTSTGLFGLTPQGQARAEDFEGCPGMLKTVWGTLVLAEKEWTQRQRRVRREFVDFGCALCHEVGPTGVGLTEIGAKAALLHMSCSEVDSTLNQ